MPHENSRSNFSVQPSLRHVVPDAIETAQSESSQLTAQPPINHRSHPTKIGTTSPHAGARQPNIKGKPARMRGLNAFRVQPQSPSNNEHLSQKQAVFQSQHVSPLNVRFKDARTIDAEASAPSTKRPAGQEIKFACNKTTVGFTERRQKPTGQIAKKPKLSKYPRENKNFLTSRKPIAAFIPIDAWALIFKRSHPKFLLQARLVCKDFREILKQQSIWREAREYTWDDAVPDCPQNVTEIQYAKLLAGRGCQISPCVNNLTKKVYWVFMLRICEKCFSRIVRLPESGSEEAKQYVMLRENLEPEVKQTIPVHLSGLLPAGGMWAGKWSQIRPLDREEQMWRYQDEPGNYCILADDYEKLKEDFRQKVASEPFYFLFWARLRWGRTKERILLAKELDAIDLDLLDKSSHRFQRHDKADFFIEKAAQLRPPMSSRVLSKMAAFHKAIDTANAASLRSWDLLATKIDDPGLRAQAEQLIEWDKRGTDWHLSAEDGLYDRLARHRGKGPLILSLNQRPQTPQRCHEQQFVLDIAGRELRSLIDVVHDEDVLLMLLDSTRKSYEATPSKPRGLNGDGTEGEYRLLLDDARVVVTEVLQPLASQKGRTRVQKLTSSLRCIACTRHDCHRTYTFEQLTIHVRNLHANRVGKNLHFWKLAVPVQSRIRRYSDSVAWYHLPWPKSFPALPSHQRAEIGMIWDPEAEMEYRQHPGEDNFSLFANATTKSSSATQSEKITDNFCYAVRILQDTRLDSSSIIKIALEYATRLSTNTLSAGSMRLYMSISQLEELESAAQKVSPRVEFKFKCGVCTRDATTALSTRRRRPREILHPQPISILGAHWTGPKHKFKVDDAMEHLIDLPSDFAVHQAITNEDKKLTAQKERVLAANRRRFGSGVDRGGELEVRDPRGEALLQVPSVWSRFNTLFKSREEMT